MLKIPYKFFLPVRRVERLCRVLIRQYHLCQLVKINISFNLDISMKIHVGDISTSIFISISIDVNINTFNEIRKHNFSKCFHLWDVNFYSLVSRHAVIFNKLYVYFKILHCIMKIAFFAYSTYLMFSETGACLSLLRLTALLQMLKFWKRDMLALFRFFLWSCVCVYIYT